MLPAQKLGKYKAFTQYCAVGFVLLPWTADYVGFQQLVFAIAVVLTLVSGLEIVRRGYTDWQRGACRRAPADPLAAGLGSTKVTQDEMRCEVLAIGTELLLGQIVDTNSAWIGEQLAASGIDSYEHRAIGDNQTRIVDALRDLFSRSDAVLVCGGLGPTQDDLTRDAIAELMGVPLVRHDELAETIAQMFRARVRDMPQNNLRQADIPEGGAAIPNPIGTAPGLLCELPDGKVVYAVPGRAVRDEADGDRSRHPRSAAALGRSGGDRVDAR